MNCLMIKNRLQEWLDELGLNYSQAAERTGVSISSIRSLAKQQASRVDFGTWEAICTSLDKPVESLFYWESGSAK